jgi:hypothetical protein
VSALLLYAWVCMLCLRFARYMISLVIFFDLVVGSLGPSVFAYHFEKLTDCVSYTYRYCRLFDSVLHTNVITHNDAALHSGAGDDDNPTDPKLIIHVYHMVAAMDGVYEFISEYHEDWRTGLRSWLLRYCALTDEAVRDFRASGVSCSQQLHCREYRL